jgi:hypothetical protein
MRAAAALVLLSAGTALACPEPFLVDVPLTKDGTLIPAGGGVVIATTNGGGRFGGEETGSLVAGKVNVELERKYIAPALTVIVPKPQANRAIELVAQSGKTLLRLTQADVAPKHAAPKVAKVHSTAPPVKKSDGPARSAMYEPSSQLTIELAEAAPEDVLALVVFQRGQGVAWAAPQPKTTTYTFWAGGKRCMPGPSTVPQGSTVTLGWVDTTGRVSVLTKDLQVGATPAPKGVK